MAPVPPSSTASAPAAPQPWWLRPYFHLFLSIFLSAAVQLLMKRGADEKVDENTIMGFSALGSLWTWASIICQIGGLLSWLYALRTAPLNIAFNLAATAHILVPLGAWWILGEQINTQRWLGILLICTGVVITARQASHVEEKL
jgi:drug/metabolite transporter (DMT)-like permease